MQSKDENIMEGQAFFRQANEIFARKRAEEPIFRGPGMYGRPVWYVTRYEDVDTVLRDSQRFALDFKLAFDAAELANIPPEPQLMAMVNSHLLTTEGEDHRRLRSLVSKAFTPRRVADLRPRIAAIAGALIDRVEDQGQMDLVEAYAFPLPITVIAEMLGIPPEDRQQFRAWSDSFVSVPFSDVIDDSNFLQSAMGFVSYLSQVFEQRRQHPQDDMITALLQAEEEGDRLSTEEMFSMVVLLIIAGHETTVSLIGNAVVALLTHPETKERLQRQPDLMPQALEEVLRYHSPVQRALTRWVTEDLSLGGQPLAKGDIVIPVLGSANRDEQHFDQPDRFEIERDNRSHLAFGRGAHYCLGAPLARLEGEIALNTLLRRLPNLRLAQPVEQLTFRETLLFHAYEHIPVAWD